MPSGIAVRANARISLFFLVVVSATIISIFMTAKSPRVPLRISSQSMVPMLFSALPSRSATPANTTSASIRLASPFVSLPSPALDSSSSAFLSMLNMKYRAAPAATILPAGIWATTQSAAARTRTAPARIRTVVALTLAVVASIDSLNPSMTSLTLPRIPAKLDPALPHSLKVLITFRAIERNVTRAPVLRMASNMPP